MTKKHEEKTKDNKEFENLEIQLRRALADYQNLEKRIVDEKASWVKLANRDLLLRLLPGLDSLLLAQKHTQDEGVKLSIKHFLDIFGQAGVKKIETEGKDFDPKFMEAVGTAEGEDNKILEETRAGYMLFDTILRPSQVVVGSSKKNQE